MSDTDHIDSWLDALPTQNAQAVDRRGYTTNLTTGEISGGENCFTNAACHQTIRSATVFEDGEQIRVAVELLLPPDLQQGIRWFRTAFHNHDFFELIYVYRGRCTTTIEGVAGELRQGDICLYNLAAVHQLSIADRDSVVFNIVMSRQLFDSTFLQLIDSAAPLSGFFMRSLYSIASPAGHLVFSGEEGAREFLHRIIAEFIRRQAMYRNMLVSCLAGLFISLSRQYESRLAELGGGETGADILRVLSYMAAHHRDITLGSLAARFGYTSRSMMRLIKKTTCRTFGDILTEFRMSSACRLLQTSAQPIEEIALAVGYGDRSYFDRVFTRFHGISPAKYRRERSGRRQYQ